MTATNLTASISGIIYPVLNTTYSLDDKVDERSTVRLTIFDANNTYQFLFGQPVTITDTFEGIKFTGFVAKSVATKYKANVALAWQLDCVDNEFLAGKKTTNRVITNQYAGVAAASMVNDHLSQDGVVANYAIRDDNSQSDFAQGTLSGTVATSNLGGDLELTLAGNTVTFHDGSIGIASSPAIKFVGSASSGYGNNLYTYRMIYSDYSTTIESQDAISYDVWVLSNSPQIMAGIDVVCTDGTTLRDATTGQTDGQGIKAHPNNDLSGFANNNAWYSRIIALGSDLTGKTLAYISIAFEGDSQGTYTAFFRNVQYLGVNSSNLYFTKINIFNSASPTLQSNSQLQNNGYYNVSVSTVTAYDSVFNYVFQNHSIDAVKIVQSSIMSYGTGNTGDITNALGQVISNGATASVQTSIDNGSSWQSITNNSAIPNLLPGMVVSGRSLKYRFNLVLGSDPTIPPYFSYFTIQINSAYQSSKTDIIKTYTTQNDFNGGTYSNTQSTGDGVLTDLGSFQNFDLSGFSQTTWGSSGNFSAPLRKQIYLQSFANADARWRFDQAGQWQNFIAEVDIQVSANYASGIVYRTTNWGNSNDSYAYSVTVNTTSILLGRGTNSTGSGSFTQITNITGLTLAEGSWHRLKVVVSGSNHQVYLDNAQYINSNNSAYTSAGYIGLRIYNPSSSTQQALFDNLGVISNYTGQWTSPNISLSSLGTYGNSMICCDLNNVPASCNVALATSIDNGSSYQACTNGGAIPGLTAGQSLSGKNLLVQVQFTAGDASAQAIVSGVTAWVMGQYSSSGTRISPVLSLANAGTAGSTAVTWTATTPANTSVAVATSTNGSTYTSTTNGGSIAGISAQPSPTLDTFDSNSAPNYTSTFFLGGSAIPWFWDTLSSRLVASGGSLGLLLYNAISASDVDIVFDMDQSDTGGIVWRYTSITNYYQLIVGDASSSSDTNTIKLVKRVSGIRNFLSAGTISFARGTYRRIRVTMIGSVIAMYFDGVLTLTYTDASPLGAGQVGLASDTGSARFYNFRVQPQGDNLSNKVVYSKVTLTSTDPTVTPQLTDLTVAALHPNIGLGALIPTANYSNTYLSDNLNDLAKKSDYTTYFDQYLNFVFGPRVAQPAPWILQSTDQQLLLDGPLTVDYSADLYRNEMVLTGVVATGTGSETKIGDGTTTSWSVGGDLTAPPTVYVNGQLKTIGIKGKDTGKDFYWTSGSNAIDQDSSGTVLQKTDTLLLQNYTYTYITTVTVDNTNLANTITQKQFAQRMGRTQAIQNVLNGASASHTSSGDFGDLAVSTCRRIAVDINITSVSGTSPTIQFFIDRKDANGIYYNIWSSNVVSAATQISTTIGAFATINQAFGATVKLRWTITGSSPSFTFSASIIGIVDVQSGGLGIVAVVEDVSSQSLNVAAATAYANGLLQKYGTQGRTITFKTWRRNPSLAIGQYLPVFIPEHNIKDASMLITGISTSQRIGTENGTPTQIYWQAVTVTENANLGSPWRLLATTLK